MATLIPLGTNGFFPSHDRHTTSFMLIKGTQGVLLDAGTGVARLAEPDLQPLLEPVQALDVVLTHYHLDHVMGLFYLPAVWSKRPIRIWGPGPPFVDSNPHEALGRLLHPPLAGNTLDDLAGDVEVRVLDQEETTIGGWAVKLWRQTHPGGSIGLRFGDTLAFMTDRAMDLSQAEKARDVQLLVHELWLSDEEATASPDHRHAHSSVGDVAAFARAARVGRIMPTHHHPSRTAEEVIALCQALEDASGLPVIHPVEGQAYPLPD